jgi:two-component system sensor histidine kinase HupT/HoxJ
MMSRDAFRIARRGELIARVGGNEEISLSEDSESMWVEVIHKMDEVYADLLGYEADLERKNAELEEARNFIAGVVASVSDVLLVCDGKGVILQINPAFQTMMELPERALLDWPLAECLTVECRAAVQAIFEPGPASRGESLELRFATARGSSDPMAVNCSARFDAQGRRAGAVFTGRPIGELRRDYEAVHCAHVELQQAQARLIEQEKMASLGRLVAGVAHELNNPISFVYGNIHTLNRYRTTLAAYLEGVHAGLPDEAREALRRRLKIDDVLEDLEPLIQGTLEGAVRISDVVKNLRRLSFGSNAPHASVELSKVVRTASHWASRGKKAKVMIETRLEPELFVFGHEGQIYSAIGNLVDNALDAVKTVPNPLVSIETRSEEKLAVIEVTDNGPGVSKDIRARIFEPFFTTKPVGEGTGLGLWIAYSIVREHGGDIDCLDLPQGGARFILRFPRCDAPGGKGDRPDTDRSG